ncbi:MAG: hypothetical protein ACYSWS_07325 [Planctomycetota bacterium]
MPSENELNRIILKWTELAGTANVAGVAGCQFKMYYDMAGEYDVKVTGKSYCEVLTTLVKGVGVWALTLYELTKIIKVFPGIGNTLYFWQPPLVATFTWAMGQVLKKYFTLIKEGKTLDKKKMKLAMKKSWDRSRVIDWNKLLTPSK